MIDKQLLTPQEAADILNVKVEYVRRMCRTGKLKSTKIGRFTRIYKDSLDSYIGT